MILKPLPLPLFDRFCRSTYGVPLVLVIGALFMGCMTFGRPPIFETIPEDTSSHGSEQSDESVETREPPNQTFDEFVATMALTNSAPLSPAEACVYKQQLDEGKTPAEAIAYCDTLLDHATGNIISK